MLYVYVCPVCASKREVIKPLAELDRVEPCLHCESPMLRQICAPAVLGDLSGYNCPITGDWIEGRRAHQENLAKHGCRVLETGEIETVKHRKADFDRRLDEALDNEVGTAITNMPHEKRQKLETEMSHNIDLGVSRGTFTPKG